MGFRLGGHNTREIDPDIRPQLNATNSILDFLVNPLLEKNISVDIFSETQTTNSTDELLTLLKPYLRTEVREILPGSQATSVLQALESVLGYVEEHGNPYRFVV